MKPIFSCAGPLAAVFAVVTLAGCASLQDAQHQQHHPQASASQGPGTGTMGPGMMSSGPSGNQMGTMDMKTMCEMHEKMMSAKTPEERAAMMNEQMKNMPPEMMQKHMQMMQEQCKR